MPFYEYECRRCGHRFEELLAYSDREEAEKAIACPHCGAREPRRLISTFTSPASVPSAPHRGCGSGG